MKEIQLSRGKITLVDDDMFEWLNQWKWSCVKGLNTEYAARMNNRQYIYMHCEILQPPEGMFTDHRDRNGRNNQKNNLRLCTKPQNGINHPKNKNNTSGYKGVYWNKYHQKWAAQIGVNLKIKHLGYFGDIEDAALAYDKAATELFGEFAQTNASSLFIANTPMIMTGIWQHEHQLAWAIEEARHGNQGEEVADKL